MHNSLSWCVGEQDTVTSVLRRAVEARPDHCFIRFESGEMATYREFDESSNAMAHGLRASGVKPGDTVGAMLDTNLDCVLSWFAANKLGAIWVPFNTALKGEFLRHQLANSGASIVLVEADYVERFERIESLISGVERLFVRGEGAVPNLQALDTCPLTQLSTDNSAALEHVNAPGDLSMLVYTSGTTGPSKGCMISHNYAVNMARTSRDGANRGENDVNWSCLPLFHLNATTTTVLAAAYTHASCYFMPRFSLSRFWESIRESGATVVNIIGQMVPLIAKQEDSEASKECFGQIRAVIAMPFDEQLQASWRERFGVQIAGANCYGLTEASLITNLKAGEYAKPGSSGKRNEDFEVMIVDQDFAELPSGDSGEIVCRPRKPHIMFEGYWKNPDKTLEVMGGMWMHTGDIGRFDEDGFLYFVDRKKDYLRRGGENVSTYEVEMALLQHASVKEAAVHSVLSELSEDEVKATIVLQDGHELTEQALCEWSADQLPYYAVPRYVEFRTELPINPLNKVMKYQLRDEGVTPQTWDRTQSDMNLVKR